MELCLDVREQKVISLLRSQHNDNLTITTESLNMGDMIYKKDGEPVLVIERKTLSDLKASLCDGRYREQKCRLIQLRKDLGCPILYLLEGNLDIPSGHNISENTLLGCIINIQIRDKLLVHRTFSLDETVTLLMKLGTQLLKLSTTPTSISKTKYASTILGKRKRDSKTPHVWFLAQLQLISQCSPIIAQAIVCKYESTVHLIQAFEELAQNSLQSKMLCAITYKTKKGKTRHIGPKLAARIHSFFYNHQEQTGGVKRIVGT